jgi:CRISPR-associated endonuclease/helicase Cas3
MLSLDFMYAHSLNGRPQVEWELLADHLRDVGARAEKFASVFGWQTFARASGQLHDIGKASAEFQAYIAAPNDGEIPGPDHSTAGAREAVKAYPGTLGTMMAFMIAGHHAGLADFRSLARRLSAEEYTIKAYAGWEMHAGSLPHGHELLKPLRTCPHGGFGASFLTRMLFSCLVDADFLATEAYYAEAEGRAQQRGAHTPLETLRAQLNAYMSEKRNTDTPLNCRRAAILDHARAKAALAPGFFTMTVPTGGGKTLASLSFALDHALNHGLRRVIYVIPYTSIIEQTADVFRQALSTDTDVLEHHANFDWDARLKSNDVPAADSEGQNGNDKLKKASENWDAPIIVTTAVQFYESLYAARTSRCRKLHNIARSVIILDEAQVLPLKVVKPCLAAIDELQRNYGASVVVCTATQPAWRVQDRALKAPAALNIEPERELAPDPEALYQALKRVAIEFKQATTDNEIAQRFAALPRMLCIVNTRLHARAIYDLIKDMDGAYHLSTLMCPVHRRAVLKDVRERLRRQLPVRLVSTSLVEAGVDVDFPEVWRAEAGLDSIAQAAGRCNREGRLAPELGRVVVFASEAEQNTPRQFRVFQAAMKETIRSNRHGEPLDPATLREYFANLYFQKGEDSLDALLIGQAELKGVLPALAERAKACEFPFRSIADAFRLIEDVMETVLVPIDERALSLLAQLRASERPLRGVLRQLQAYAVSIPKAARDDWLAAGVLRAAHPALSDTLLTFADRDHYRDATGLDLKDRFARNPASNIQ